MMDIKQYKNIYNDVYRMVKNKEYVMDTLFMKFNKI